MAACLHFGQIQCRILREKQPKCFIAENVKGILTANKKNAFPLIIKEFEDSGYDVSYAILNSANYGVPQKRERVIIVGFRKDLDIKFVFPDATVLDENAFTPLSDVIENAVDEKYFFSQRAVTTSESNGIQVLKANNFYDLFGGQPFRDIIRQNYESERNNRICKEGSLINGISALLGQNEQYERDYAKHSDIKERLEQCTFDKAEQAYLTLKLKRNRVAHDYIHGSSDSFEDVRNFYYDAVLFVIGLEKTFEGLTNQPT